MFYDERFRAEDGYELYANARAAGPDCQGSALYVERYMEQYEDRYRAEHAPE